MISIKKLFSRFYISAKARTNGFHQVHREGCPFLPGKENRIYLGIFTEGKNAIDEGRSYFTKSECCRFCMNEDHQERKEMVFKEISYAVDLHMVHAIDQSYENTLHSYAS